MQTVEGIGPARVAALAAIGITTRQELLDRGAAAAHNARGWRSIVLPFLGVIFGILVPVLVQMMVSSALFSLKSLLTQLGLMP